VNMAPAEGGDFLLITAPVQVFSCGKVKSGVRGWFRPSMPISDFLSAYSSFGGTHHSALVYGGMDEIRKLCKRFDVRMITLG